MSVGKDGVVRFPSKNRRMINFLGFSSVYIANLVLTLQDFMLALCSLFGAGLVLVSCQFMCHDGLRLVCQFMCHDVPGMTSHT